jgi:hypothetical protein
MSAKDNLTRWSWDGHEFAIDDSGDMAYYDDAAAELARLERELENAVRSRTEDANAYQAAMAQQAERAMRLERELAESERLRGLACDERDHYQHQAEMRYAMRREIEELLGYDDGGTYDPAKFAEAVEKLRGIVRELAEARALLREALPCVLEVARARRRTDDMTAEADPVKTITRNMANAAEVIYQRVHNGLCNHRVLLAKSALPGAKEGQGA